MEEAFANLNNQKLITDSDISWFPFAVQLRYKHIIVTASNAWRSRLARYFVIFQHPLSLSPTIHTTATILFSTCSSGLVGMEIEKSPPAGGGKTYNDDKSS